MQLMKAVVLTTIGGGDGLEIQELPKPQPKPNQVLVRVHATSLNPVDYQTRRSN